MRQVEIIRTTDAQKANHVAAHHSKEQGAF